MKSKLYNLNMAAVGAGIVMLALLALSGAQPALALSPDMVFCSATASGGSPTGHFLEYGTSVLLQIGDCADTTNTSTEIFDDGTVVSFLSSDIIPTTFNCNLTTGTTNQVNKKPAPFPGSIPGFAFITVSKDLTSASHNAGCQSFTVLTGVTGSLGAEFLQPGGATQATAAGSPTCGNLGATVLESCSSYPQ